jgi:integrase
MASARVPPVTHGATRLLGKATAGSLNRVPVPPTFTATAAHLLRESRAPNSHSLDLTVSRHFHTFCLLSKRSADLRQYPRGSAGYSRQEQTLNEFVAYLASLNLTASTCKTYLTSLGAQLTRDLGFNPIRSHNGYRLCIRGLRRIQARDTRISHREDLSKLPLTMDILRRGLRNVNQYFSPTLRTLLLTGVCFMLRVSELVPCDGTDHYLRRRDVSFGPINPDTNLPRYVRICIPSSKTEMTPAWRQLGANSSPTCVVQALYMYTRSHNSRLPDTPLFAPLSRADVTRAIKVIAVKAGIDPTRLSAHSLRRGGATTLAQQGSIPGYLVQKHGRWSTDTWVHIYQAITNSNADALAHAFA